MTYRSLKGLKSILYQMSKRTRFPSNMSLEVLNIKKKYSNSELDFKIFFNELEDFVRREKENIL